MEGKIRQSVKRVLQSSECVVFEGFFSIFGKICRRSLRERVVRKYGRAIKAAFANLRRVAMKELENFSSPAEKMEFYRVLRRSTPAWAKFYRLNLPS
jgi:hypothetical protein